jgi:hypothetical protein
MLGKLTKLLYGQDLVKLKPEPGSIEHGCIPISKLVHGQLYDGVMATGLPHLARWHGEANLFESPEYAGLGRWRMEAFEHPDSPVPADHDPDEIFVPKGTVSFAAVFGEMFRSMDYDA